MATMIIILLLCLVCKYFGWCLKFRNASQSIQRYWIFVNTYPPVGLTKWFPPMFFFTRYLSPGSNHMEYRTRFWQLHSVTSICFVELVFCCWILRQMDAKLHSLKLTRTLPPIRIWCVRSQIKIEMIRFAGHSFCHVLTNPSVPLAYRWNNGFSRSLAKSSIFFRVGLECLECVIIHNRSGK